MQNKNIIILVSLLVIIMLGWKLTIYFQKNPGLVETPVTIDKSATSSPASSTPNTTKTMSEQEKEINTAWTVFQKYLTATKNFDLKTVTELSYQIGTTCKDASQTKKCNDLMYTAYSFGKDMKESDYKNAWYDNKQIILFTDEQEVSTTTMKGFYRGFIYFTKDANGTPKFLSLNPEVGAYALTKDKTPAQVDKDVRVMLKDSDQDGLADDIEACKNNPSSTCIKTDPNKHDTNSNGWWDGIEALFYVKP